MKNTHNDLKLSAWVSLLVFASVLLSLAFACAMPFAALATIAALSLPRKAGFGLIISAWVANQLVGYLFLAYPQTLNSFAWGVAIGAAALGAFYVARSMVTYARFRQPLWLSAATLLASFAAYETVLFIAAYAGLGRMEDFAPAIVLSLLATNAVALALLLTANNISSRAGFLSLPLKPHYA